MEPKPSIPNKYKIQLPKPNVEQDFIEIINNLDAKESNNRKLDWRIKEGHSQNTCS